MAGTEKKDSNSPAGAGSPPAAAAAGSPAKSPSKSPSSGRGEGTQSPGALPNFLPAQHWIDAGQNFERDNDDRDSAAGDDDHGSSTASLTSSILHYRTINGRTYHSETGNAQYWAANDDKQNESMDIHHHLLTLALDSKLYRAPLDQEKPIRVLDVGTGTGIWAIDFADEHPNASVIGTDISPIQPGWVPPNLEFVIDDCTQSWTFEPNSFDYIHMRYLFGSIVDWPALYKEAYRACAPGGWVESHEANARVESNNNSLPEDSALNEWTKFFIAGEEKLGRPFMIVDLDLQKKGMEEAGFVDIDVYDINVPMGGWPKDRKLKEMGQYLQLVLETDMEGYILFIASMVLGWSQPEVTVYCAQMRRELRSGRYQPMYQQRVVCGRKPK